MTEVDPKVHAGEPRYGTPDVVLWHKDGSCGYCGSLPVPEVVRLLKTPGTTFSGTDKTTYKSYVNDHKFYFRHLRACTDAELAEFDALARKVFGLAFDRDANGGIRCRYPDVRSAHGWQTYGVIGPDSEPVHDRDAPKPPSAEWWTQQP